MKHTQGNKVMERINHFQDLQKALEEEKKLISELSFKYSNLAEMEKNAVLSKDTSKVIENQRAADKCKAEMEEHKRNLSKVEEEINSSREEARQIYLILKDRKSTSQQELNQQIVRWFKLKNEFFDTMKEIHNLNAHYVQAHNAIAKPIQSIFGFDDEDANAVTWDIFTNGFIDPTSGSYDLTYQGFAHGLDVLKHKNYMNAMDEAGYTGIQTTEEWMLEATIKSEVIQEAKKKAEEVERAEKEKEDAEKFKERSRIHVEFRKKKEEDELTLREKVKKKLGI